MISEKDQTKKLRGVEAALYVWRRVANGATISEELRALGDRVAPTDRVLAAGLCYAMARRFSLWGYLRDLYMKPRPTKFSRAAQTAVLAGAAGLMELKNFAPAVLISALVDWTKSHDPRGARVVNAVLRSVLEQAPDEIARLRASSGFEEFCVVNGMPIWVGQKLATAYGDAESRRLIEMSAIQPALSLRLAPDAPRQMAQMLTQAGRVVSESPLPDGLRLDGTALPSALPGYDEGWFTPQSESSITVGCEAADFYGEYILDMCAGRGVKTGQIAQLRPDATVEAWDLSQGRIDAAEREMTRLGLGSVTTRCGDALTLQPLRRPDAVLVDAPCSGSGTWRRHPEGKWRLTPEEADKLIQLQTELLTRALTLVKPGGKVIYSTCSLMAEENENVVAKAIERASGAAEVSPDTSHELSELPRAHGRIILPENAWTDGFYMAVLRSNTKTEVH